MCAHPLRNEPLLGREGAANLNTFRAQTQRSVMVSGKFI
jgi:hypothetical protein